MNKFGLLLFTRFTIRNQRCLALNESTDKFRSCSKIGNVYFRRCVARQIIYLPSCVDRQMAMICGQQSQKLPSCVAREMAMICGHQSKTLSSCVARQMVMTCGHQSKELPSFVTRQTAMICGEKSNIPSASETNWCSFNGGNFIQSFDYKGLQQLGDTQFLFGQYDELTSNKIRSVFTLDNKINVKSSSKSCTQPSCKASINYTLHCDYLASYTLSVAGAARIETTHPAITHWDKPLPINKANKKRKRDREPSRIRVNRIFKVLQRKKFRHKVKNLLRKNVPNNSFINYLCGNYKYWNCGTTLNTILVNMCFFL